MIGGLVEAPPRRGTLLVVDDEEGVRASFRVLLKDEFTVLEAEDGEQALEVLRRHEVDVVMLDQRLPGEPGIDVLSRIKALDPLVVVVLARWLAATWRWRGSIGSSRRSRRRRPPSW